MCLLGLIFTSEGFVCLHNRDEDLSRPTQPLAFHGSLLYSKDERAGGSWMGLNAATGVFVALTNRRRVVEPSETVKISRGQLVIHLLSGAVDLSLLAAAADVHVDGSSIDLGYVYGGFNIIISSLYTDIPCVMLLTNDFPLLRERSHAWVQHVRQGIHAMSNSFFNDDSWAKVRHLKSSIPRLATLVASRSVPGHPLSDVLKLSSTIMNDPTPLPESAVMSDLAWSPLPPSEELYLQRHLFFSPVSLAGCLEATQCTTVVLKLPGLRRTVAYCFRSFQWTGSTEASEQHLPPSTVPSHDSESPELPGGRGDIPPNVSRIAVTDASGRSWEVFFSAF